MELSVSQKPSTTDDLELPWMGAAKFSHKRREPLRHDLLRPRLPHPRRRPAIVSLVRRDQRDKFLACILPSSAGTNGSSSSLASTLLDLLRTGSVPLVLPLIA